MNIRDYFRTSPSGKLKSERFAFRRLPAITQIVLSIIVCIIAVSTITAIIIIRATHTALVDRSLEELHQVSLLEAYRLQEQINADIDTIQRFAQDPVVLDGLRDSLESGLPDGEHDYRLDANLMEHLGAFRDTNEGVVGAAIVDRNQAVLALWPNTGQEISPSAEEWPWFDDAMALRPGGVFIAGLIVNDRLTGAEGVHLAVPVYTDSAESPLGVVYIVFDPGRYTFSSQFVNGHDIALYLANGDYLIRSTDSTAYRMPFDTWDQISESRSGTIHEHQSDEYDQLYGFVTLADIEQGINSKTQDLEWIVVAQHSDTSVLAEVRQTTNRLLLAVSFGAGILILLSIAFAFAIGRPYLELAGSAEEIITRENYDLVLKPYTQRDTGMLSSVLNRLIEQLRYRSEQLDTATSISQTSLEQATTPLLDEIARTIHQRLGYHIVRIFLTGERRSRAHLQTTYGPDDMKVGDRMVISNTTTVGRAAHTGKMQYNEGIEAAIAAVDDEPADLAIPFEGNISGILQVIGDRPHAFDPTDIEVLRLIANQVGAMLENRFLFEGMQAAQEAAERANQVKSQFLAAMSHELRTPLNAILNFSKFVSSGMLGEVNEKQKDVVEKITSSGQHLLNLINDVLDISKIESGSLRLFVERDINLYNEVQQVVDTAKVLLANKPVELYTDFENNLPLIIGDRRRIRQVMLNLISNACKFTDTGSVTIKFHKEGEDISFSVRDTGPGIAEEDQEKIFETFQQTDAGLRQGEGTGLGLPIARRLIEAHEGRLWVESQPGEGATFTFTIPFHSDILEAQLDPEYDHVK
jgi:signal transduction histidine kinase